MRVPRALREDLQEVCLRAVARLKSATVPKSVMPLLYTITKGVVVDWWRRSKLHDRPRVLSLEEVDAREGLPGPDPSLARLQAVQHSLFLRKARSAGFTPRQISYLSWGIAALGRMPQCTGFASLARRMGLSTGDVRELFNRAMDRLQLL